MTVHRNFCVECNERLEDTAKSMGLSKAEVALLAHAQRTVSLAIPVRMDDGSVRVFEGVRVQYNDALGPTKGGLRYHLAVDEQEVATLAFLMTLKNSLAGLPYGGGKGGVRCDPKTMSSAELERLTRGYVRAIGQAVGPQFDIPAPDVNTTAEMMGWFADEYARVVGHPEPAVVTGKPVALGGSRGRDSATGLGGVYLLERYAHDMAWHPSRTSVAIQGFGNVGSWFARLAAEKGFKVVAVSGSREGSYCKEGWSAETLARAAAEKALPPGEKITNDALLALPVDVLVPAALSEQITAQNAQSVQARLVIEMANAPTSVEADGILEDKHIVVIPDILANAGGVIVSYFEWVQNLSAEAWSESAVAEKLQEKIIAAYERVVTRARERHTSMREAAYAHAIERVVDAERARGRV